MTLFTAVSESPLISRLCGRAWRWGVLPVLLLALTAPAMADERLIAIGDVHGNYGALEELLQQANLLGKKLEWSGKRATLVFTGDLLDRGADSRKVLDLLMRLEGEANRRRGHVIVVLGNHEIMNMMGDLRYVSAEEYASFADTDSFSRRDRAFEQYGEFVARKYREYGQKVPAMGAKVRKAWEDAHPAGFFAHRDAYGPNGEYGAWLRRRPVLARVGDYLFLHGGISPALSNLSLKEINRRIWSELETFDSLKKHFIDKEVILPFFTLKEMTVFVRAELDHWNRTRNGGGDAAGGDGNGRALSKEERKHVQALETFLDYPRWFSFHRDGPVWFRGYAQWDEEEGLAKIAPVLKQYRVKHVVVGHSPHSYRRIHHRFGSAVILIDTGMLSSSFQGGRPSALEVRGSEWSAIYPEGRREVAALEEMLPPGEEDSKPLVGTDRPVDSRLGEGVSAKLRTRWLDPNGNRLPFESEEELIDFMKTAKVVWRKVTDEGITKPWKVLLEEDGVQVHAIFRYVSIDKKPIVASLGPPQDRYLRDHYIFEVVAYELGIMLGLDVIPPAVERADTVGGKRGSVQVWVEDAMTERVRVRKKITPPDQERWSHQMRTLAVFDELIGNIDRNLGNILIDREWTMWLIDHTRAFQAGEGLMNASRIIGCERSLWEKIQALDKETVRLKFKKYLSEGELDDLMERRDAIVHHLKGLIAIQSEEEVIYSYPEDVSAVEKASVHP